MRIACPDCGAAYDVPPERVPPGRTVKCARCASSWVPVPEAAVLAAQPGGGRPAPDLPAPNVIERIGTAMPVPAIRDPAPAEPAFDVIPVPKPAPSPPGRTHPGRHLAAAWVLSVLVLAGLGWVAVHRRADIMRAWPPSARAYIALGLATAPR